jgi:hypothetical protein
MLIMNDGTYMKASDKIRLPSSVADGIGWLIEIHLYKQKTSNLYLLA